MTHGDQWWSRGEDHTLFGDVPAAPELVRAFYTDLHNIQCVHPLVVSVHSTGRTNGPDGYVEEYRVRDRIALGPLTLAIGYTARLAVPIRGDVVTEARQFPGVRLDGVVSFDPVGSGTRITERLRIAAPRPLAAVTVRQAVAAHAEMLAGIRRCFQKGPPTAN